jgi:hypothetical protein
MLMMAKTMLDINRVPILAELFEKIDETSSEKLLELARTNFNFEEMSSLTYLPE